MGFFSSIGGAVLGGLTGGITNSIMGKIDPAPKQQKMSRSDIRMGHEEDTKSFKDRAQYSWDQAKERGLTPQEFYGSSAAGGSSSSGGAQVLGNSQDKANQINQQQHQETKERNKDRMTQLKVAQIGAGNVQLQTDTTKRGQDFTYDIQQKNYQLAQQKLQQIELPKLKAELKISSQQFKQMTNQIATSTPKFMLYMKKLSMGVDNMMVEFLQHSFGIDITDPKSVQGMSPSRRAAFINATAAINSSVFKEAAGIGKITTDTLTNVFGQSKKPDDYKHGSVHGSPKSNKPSTLGSQRQSHRSSLLY